jgi:hypothetical protein
MLLPAVFTSTVFLWLFMLMLQQTIKITYTVQDEQLALVKPVLL